MDAEFFVIMPAMHGWDLYHGMESRGWFPKWGDALEAADVMAGAHYDATGTATAVVVEMRNRDSAVVNVYA